VISNKADAYGLVRASKAGVQAIYLPKGEKESREEYDTRLAACVSSSLPDYVILAGWMRILSFAFLSSFPQRVINLHPALPGMFPGTHAIERAYNAYQRGEIDRSGAMVHLVPDEGVDNGPVLGLQEIYFVPKESLERFEARVHEIEHRLLVNTLKKILEANKRSA
jgi:formyltetrahydrofolate-dependent phosphoribosylglycinamide formyltransferase